MPGIKRIATLLILLVLAGFARAAVPATPLPALQPRYDQLQQLEDSLHGSAEAAHGAALAVRFRELFPQAADGDALNRLDDASLHLLFQAARTAGFYHPDPYALDAMLATVAELDRRGAAESEELVKARNALLAARRLDAARTFGQAHPDAGLSPLPAFRDAGADPAGRPTVWQEVRDGRLERTPLDLGPAQILVLAGCHFSDDAARSIDADPVFGPLFREHARWLGMPPGNEDPTDVREWNREHPHAPMLQLYDRDEWPMFPRWVMPTFYIVRDGAVLGSVRGWIPESRAELIPLLQQAGLLP